MAHQHDKEGWNVCQILHEYATHLAGLALQQIDSLSSKDRKVLETELDLPRCTLEQLLFHSSLTLSPHQATKRASKCDPDHYRNLYNCIEIRLRIALGQLLIFKTLEIGNTNNLETWTERFADTVNELFIPATDSEEEICKDMDTFLHLRESNRYMSGEKEALVTNKWAEENPQLIQIKLREWISTASANGLIETNPSLLQPTHEQLQELYCLTGMESVLKDYRSFARIVGVDIVPEENDSDGFKSDWCDGLINWLGTWK